MGGPAASSGVLLHLFLIHAESLGRALPPGERRPVLACVSAGPEAAAEAVALGELHRAGWKALEVVGPERVRREFPALKRDPAVARAMAAARQRGCAFLVMEAP